MTDYESQGKTTVSPEVLITIARLSALSVPGVSRLAPISGGVNRFFKRGAGDGVGAGGDAKLVKAAALGDDAGIDRRAIVKLLDQVVKHPPA